MLPLSIVTLAAVEGLLVLVDEKTADATVGSDLKFQPASNQ